MLDTSLGIHHDAKYVCVSKSAQGFFEKHQWVMKHMTRSTYVSAHEKATYARCIYEMKWQLSSGSFCMDAMENWTGYLIALHNGNRHGSHISMPSGKDALKIIGWQACDMVSLLVLMLCNLIRDAHSSQET